MGLSNKITVPVLSILPKELDLPTGELADKTFQSCNLCERQVGLYTAARRMAERLSGSSDSFYCPFCLRNRFNTKAGKDLLILSFKGIIGFYYEVLYRNKGDLCYSQIKDYIQSHREAGLENPVFFYDDQSFNWFIDFSRIGRGNKKVRLSEVLQTVVSILSCFNMAQVVPGANLAKMFEKYQEAISKFCAHRYRPEGRRLLIPTLSGCADPPYQTTGVGYVHNTASKKSFDFENTRNFTIERFVMRR